MDLKIFAGEPAQNHGLDPLEIKQAVLEGGLKGFEERRARIIVHQAEQASQQRCGITSGIAFLESLKIGNDFGKPLQKEFFVEGPSRSVAAPGRADGDVPASGTCGRWTR
jgi:hypothetical protein